MKVNNLVLTGSGQVVLDSTGLRPYDNYVKLTQTSYKDGCLEVDVSNGESSSTIRNSIIGNGNVFKGSFNGISINSSNGTMSLSGVQYKRYKIKEYSDPVLLPVLLIERFKQSHADDDDVKVKEEISPPILFSFDEATGGNLLTISTSSGINLDIDKSFIDSSKVNKLSKLFITSKGLSTVTSNLQIPVGETTLTSTKQASINLVGEVDDNFKIDINSSGTSRIHTGSNKYNEGDVVCSNQSSVFAAIDTVKARAEDQSSLKLNAERGNLKAQNQSSIKVIAESAANFQKKKRDQASIKIKESGSTKKRKLDLSSDDELSVSNTSVVNDGVVVFNSQIGNTGGTNFQSCNYSFGTINL